MNKPNHKVLTFASALLAGSLLFGSVAYPSTVKALEVGQTASVKMKTSFPDVPATHWGLKHISKLALLGIIEGDEYGFRPEDKVSQQDVLVMAIRMLGLEDEAKSLNGTTTVLPFDVMDYAKNYVVIADKYGLIDRSEETAVKGSGAWGSRSATREWVAKIVVRALGRAEEAKQLSSTPTVFVDNKDIAANNVGFVGVASKLGIVQGFEKGDFQPKGVVTRAQMATFLSRSDQYMTGSQLRVTKGYVVEISSNKLVLQDEAGMLTEFKVAPEISYYSSKSETKIAQSAIKPTYEVSVIGTGGTAYYVEVTNDSLQMEVYEGTLAGLYLSEMEVALKIDGKFKNFELTPTVMVTDTEGRGLSLSTIPENSIIELRRNKLVKDPKISQIIVKQVPVNKTAEGTINLITRSEIAVNESTTGKLEAYPLSSRLVVLNKDNTLGEFAGLRSGDVVSYEVVNNEVSKITVKKSADVAVTIQGTLAGIDITKRIVTVTKPDGKLAAYYLADTAGVTITGLQTAGFYDLETGDQLQLSLVNDMVTNVTVTNRTIKNSVFATIIGYDTEKKVLTLEDENGDLAAYSLTDSTKVIYADSEVPMSSFANLFPKGRRVDIQVSKNKLLSIRYSNKVEGKLAQLNLTTRDVTIRTASGQDLTFKMGSQVFVEIPNQETANFADLKIGDSVKLNLTFDQLELTYISVLKSGNYKIATKDNNQKSVLVTDEAGNLLTFQLNDSSIPMAGPGGTKISFDSLAVDQVIQVKMSGKTIEKLTVLETARGQVTLINADGSFNVDTGKGIIKVDKDAALTRNGVAMLQSNLKVGDRVDAVHSLDGKWTVTVAVQMKRTVTGFIASLNRLVLLPQGTERTEYNVHPAAVVRDASGIRAVSSLASGEVVTLYYIGNTLVDVEI